MRHRIQSLRALLTLGMGLLAGSPIRAQSQPTAPLAGLWKLNNDLSEHFEDKLDAARRPGAYTGIAGGRPRVGGAGRAGGPHMNRAEGERGQEGQEMANLMHPVLQVLIRQDDSTVSISDAAGQMQVFHTDGRKEKEPLLTGAEMETSAKWKDGKLTIERKQDKAGVLKETYDVDPVSKRMILTVKLTTKSLVRSLEFRRVYDPAPSPGN